MTARAGSQSAVPSSSADSTLADWAAELADRLQGGEDVDLDAYAREHPDRAAELRRILPAIRLMTVLAASGDAGSRPDPLGWALNAGGDRRTLGDFDLLREVGRGGMGIVYEAIQRSLRRRVAVKVLPFASALDPRQLLRFQAEAQVVARLHHNHIVPVFATGCECGVPYYAMQFINGRDLAQLIRQRQSKGSSAVNRDDFRVIAELGKQAAEALEFAHANDVLHRDIKPSNLLVDDEGHLWITDFGLARVRGDLELTQTGDAPGTPRYMSPEQALGRRDAVGVRSDLYSLGATLYELVTGVPAFAGDDRLTLLDRIVREEPAAIGQLNPRVPAELETIVMTAMAKDPGDRYATARDLAGDLHRFLEGRPILARRPTYAARALRWSRRHQRVVLGAGLAAVLAASALVGASWWSNVLLREYNMRLKGEIARADRNATESDRHRRTAVAQRRQADRLLYLANLRLAGQALDLGQLERAQDILHDAASAPGGSEHRDFAWGYLWRLARKDVIALRGHDQKVKVFAASSDGRSVASADWGGTLLLWDVEAERPRARLTVGDEFAWDPKFTPDGRTLAALVGDGPDGRDARAVTWDVATARRLSTVKAAPGKIHTLYFVDGGRLLGIEAARADGTRSASVWTMSRGAATGDRPCFVVDGAMNLDFAAEAPVVVAHRGDRVDVLDARSGATRLSITGQFGLGGPWVISPDGLTLAGAAHRLVLLVRDVRTGEPVRTDRLEEGISHLGFGPDGSSLVLLDARRRVQLRDRTGALRHMLRPDDAERDRRVLVAFSADGALLATSSHGTPGGQHPVTVWDVASGKPLRRYPGRPDHVSCLAFAADGRSLYLDGGPLLCRWRMQPDSPPSPAGHADEAWALAFSPDGRVLASGSDDTEDDATIKLWDAESARLLRGWRGHPATVSALAYHPNGRTLASGSLSPSENLKLWDAATGRLLATLTGHTDRVRSVVFSPDGATLASSASDGSVRLWDASTGRPRKVLRGHTGAVSQVAFRDDGEVAASGGTDETIRLWDAATGRPIGMIRVAEKVSALAFVPGGRTLAAADESGRITLWDSNAGALLRVIRAEGDELRCLAIAPDGRTLAAAGMSRSIRLWDIETGQEALTLPGHSLQVNALKFAPGGRSLASCSHDGSVRIWRAGPGP